MEIFGKTAVSPGAYGRIGKYSMGEYDRIGVHRVNIMRHAVAEINA